MALKKFEEKEGRKEGGLEGDKILKLHDAPPSPIKHTLSHKLPFSSSFITEFGTGSHLCSGRREDTIEDLGEAAGDKAGRAGTSEWCSRQNGIPSLGNKGIREERGHTAAYFASQRKSLGTEDFLETGRAVIPNGRPGASAQNPLTLHQGIFPLNSPVSLDMHLVPRDGTCKSCCRHTDENGIGWHT